MHIREATLADVSNIATLSSEAMVDDEIANYISPYLHQHFADFRNGAVRRCRARFYGGMLMLVAVIDSSDSDWDGVETIVGHAALKRITENPATTSWTTKLNKSLTWIEDHYRWLFHTDKSMDRSNFTEFLSHVSQDPFANVKEAWELDLLVIKHQLQRRGIGTLLLKEALRIAEKDHLPLQLIASKKGAGLYHKIGMKEIGAQYVGNGVTAKCFSTMPENQENSSEN